MMADSAGNFRADIEELTEFAQEKRNRLIVTAERRKRLRRGLIVLSGVLALASGGFLTVVIARFTDSDTLKVISAVLAFSSGIISLFMSAYFDDKETQKMFDGAAKYLALRENVKNAGSDPNMTMASMYSAIKKLRAQYVKLSEDYDHLVSLRVRTNEPYVMGHYIIGGTVGAGGTIGVGEIKGVVREIVGKAESKGDRGPLQ
jgi:hypothetical protein